MRSTVTREEMQRDKQKFLKVEYIDGQVVC